VTSGIRGEKKRHRCRFWREAVKQDEKKLPSLKREVIEIRRETGHQHCKQWGEFASKLASDCQRKDLLTKGKST